MKPSNIRIAANNGLLVLKKFAPHLLVGGGALGTIFGTVLIAKATLKADDILEKSAQDQEKVDKVHAEKREGYSEEDYKKDCQIVKIGTAKDLAIAYAPGIGVYILSMTAILAGFGILNKRHVALAAAYNVLSDNFDKYRKRVIKDVGKEKDHEYRTGLAADNVVDVDDEGNVKEKTRPEEQNISPYAKFFDECNENWVPDSPEMNLLFLKQVQGWCNRKLNIDGHLFLNEVYEQLGYPHTSLGAITGWIKDGDGDGYVDFGIFDEADKLKRMFVNGWEPAILLDFNVDGVIYDKI